MPAEAPGSPQDAPEASPGPQGHLFTLAEAAAAVGLHKDSIKRRRAAGHFPHAVKDDAGQWVIPLADLLADGLHPHAPTAPEAVPEGGAPPAESWDRVRALEAEVHELRAVLAERDRALRIAETALRALPAPEVRPGASAESPTAAPPGESRARGHWWRRR